MMKTSLPVVHCVNGSQSTLRPEHLVHQEHLECHLCLVALVSGHFINVRSGHLKTLPLSQALGLDRKGFAIEHPLKN